MDPLVAHFTTSWIMTLIWAIIARSLISWFPIDQSAPIIQVLFRVTEPIIEPFRRVMPNTGMFDLSPLAAIFGLFLLMYSLEPLIATS